MEILDIIRDAGYTTVPEAFYKRLEQYREWYEGYVGSFHSYRLYTGQGYKTLRRYSACMAKRVCEDWGNLLMNEKCKVTAEGSAEQEYIDSVFDLNNFRVKASEMQELKAAYGTVAYIPRVTGVQVNQDGNITAPAKRIVIDYVTGDNIYPLKWENGMIAECVFATDIADGKDRYKYLQWHILNDAGTYDIRNTLYKSSDATRNGNYAQVPLASVQSLSHIPEMIHTHSDKPQYIIDRLNIVNNYDNTIPLGVPAFANAIDNLKAVDITYDSYVNEFVLGKKRVLVKPEALKRIDGTPVFDPDDVAFYALAEDSSTETIIHELDFKLRTAEHNAGMQDMLNMLSQKCGFGSNHYKFDSGSIATATQVVSENSELYRNIRKHEIILSSVLINLCRTLLRLGNQYQGIHLNEDVEISVDFDDSIIEDKNAEFQRDLQMLSAGIMNAYEFRMKWMNEDEATAKAALPGLEELVE